MTTRLIKTEFIFVVALVLVTANMASGIIYCANHTYQASMNSTHMQFTKEVVTQEYAIEGEFKGLHCCAKGYRSIEWLKDGRSYPWSAEETSSLILYPEAANQTIYARHASKIDEGKYTCVLRNATHKMEHHIELKVKSSSPDIPLATFRPVDQFVNVGGSARFYCEAFVGKKDFPKILISIKWYQMLEDGTLIAMMDERQEEVKREDEQIVGSYLTIAPVTVDDYGRYLCRIEMGNSETHRLDMPASLINALPMKANAKSILSNPYFLGLCAAVSTIITFFLIAYCTQKWWMKYFGISNLNKEEVLQMKNRELANLTIRQPHSTRSATLSAREKYDDIKLQIGNT